MTDPEPRLVPPPLIAAVAALAQAALARGHRPTLSSCVAAGSLVAGSVALARSAISEFGRHLTTIHPTHPEEATTLVTTGVNRFTRNPMYVGVTGLLLAHATLRRSAAALLPVAGFVLVVDRVQVRAEEAALRRRFGPAYDDYCGRVPRWAPGIGRGAPPQGNVAR